MIVGNSASDSILRAITDDGSFRVITARSTSTVRGAVRAQAAEGAVAARFGELLTGTLLIREAMAPQFRVQGVLKSAGGGSLVADSYPDGTNRGLVNFGAKGTSDVTASAGSLLQMMRSLANGSIQQGVVEVPAPGGISVALMAYMHESEQVVSMIDVAVVLDAAGVVSAGGYLVQLLPEAQRGPLMVMTERLADLPPLEDMLLRGDASPDALLDELLYGMPFTPLDRSHIEFSCRCSELRLIESLGTLPRAELKDLAGGDSPLEITCDYCGKHYAIATHMLRGMLTES